MTTPNKLKVVTQYYSAINHRFFAVLHMNGIRLQHSLYFLTVARIFYMYFTSGLCQSLQVLKKQNYRCSTVIVRILCVSRVCCKEENFNLIENMNFLKSK